MRCAPRALVLALTLALALSLAVSYTALVIAYNRYSPPVPYAVALARVSHANASLWIRVPAETTAVTVIICTRANANANAGANANANAGANANANANANAGCREIHSKIPSRKDDDKDLEHADETTVLGLASAVLVSLGRLSPASRYNYAVVPRGNLLHSQQPFVADAPFYPSVEAAVAELTRSAGSAAEAGAAGTFETLPQAGTPTRMTFAFGSCMVANPWVQLGFFSAFKDVAGADLAILLGDNVYTDISGVAVRPPREQMYRQLFADPHFAALGRTTPMWFTYDDHEFADNFDVSRNDEDTRSLLRDGGSLFHAFLGSRNPQQEEAGSGAGAGWKMGDGEAFEAVWGDIGFFVVDGRAHRTGDSLLGSEQRARLSAWLARDDLAWKVLASGCPFSSWSRNDWGGSDGFHAYPDELAWLMAAVRASPTPVTLLSGDVHYAAVWEHGDGGPLELSVSPLLSAPLAHNLRYHGGDRQEPENVLMTSGGAFHFGAVTLDTAAGSLHFQLYRWTTGPPRVVYELVQSANGTIVVGRALDDRDAGL